MELKPREPPRRRGFLGRMLPQFRRLLTSGSEMLLAVALVLLFAAFFLGILVYSFPKGTGLVNLYEELMEPGARSSEIELRGAGNEPAFVAVLQDVTRRVRDRPADALTWNNAHAGLALGNRHTVQTLGRSAAAISFGDRGQLSLGERSLVVVKQDDGQRPARRRRAEVVLLGGRVNGEITTGRGASPTLDIVTTGGTSQIRSRGGADTEFSVIVNPDESSTVSIYSGTAEITTAAGPQRIGPNEALTFDVGGALGSAVPIPDPPRLLAPADGHALNFGSVTPRIEFRWAGLQNVEAYRLKLARDDGFDDPVYEGKLSRTTFVHGNLTAGRYFWRVTAVSDRVESRPGKARSFRLIEDLRPPRLEVELPQQIVTDSRLVVRGTAEPGSELFIEDESVPLGSSGEFEHALSLKRGLNMIVIEAVDAAGNSAYTSQYVTARF